MSSRHFLRIFSRRSTELADAEKVENQLAKHVEIISSVAFTVDVEIIVRSFLSRPKIFSPIVSKVKNACLDSKPCLSY